MYSRNGSYAKAPDVVVRGFEGSRPPPIAVAFVRLDAERSLFRD